MRAKHGRLHCRVRCGPPTRFPPAPARRTGGPQPASSDECDPLLLLSPFSPPRYAVPTLSSSLLPPASPAPATSAIPPSCCPPPSPLPLLPTDPAMSTCEQTFAETHAHACARCWTRFVAVFLRPAAVCRLSQRRRAGGRGGVRRDAVPPALPRVRPVIVPAIVPALPPATAAGNHLYPRSFAEALAKKGGGRRGDQVRD